MFITIRRFWERTRELRDTLGDLAGRIAALELALQASHAITSSLLHPLLEEDMLKIKEPYLRAPSPISPISQPIPTTGSSSPREPTDTSSASVSSSTTKSDTCTGVVEALGSLSINRNGRTKYFGPAALASVSVLVYGFIAIITDEMLQCFLAVCEIPDTHPERHP
jgi:hypothetical protein